MKFSNFIMDFLRLEPPIFCSEFIVFLVKIETDKLGSWCVLGLLQNGYFEIDYIK